MSSSQNSFTVSIPLNLERLIDAARSNNVAMVATLLGSTVLQGRSDIIQAFLTSPVCTLSYVIQAMTMPAVQQIRNRRPGHLTAQAKQEKTTRDLLVQYIASQLTYDYIEALFQLEITDPGSSTNFITEVLHLVLEIPNLRNNSDNLNNLLTLAVYHNLHAFVPLLLQAGADINTTVCVPAYDAHSKEALVLRSSLLIEAVVRNHPKVVGALLDSKSQKLNVNRAISIADEEKEKAKITKGTHEKLIKIDRVSLRSLMPDTTALLHAAQYGYAEYIERLHQQGADIHAVTAQGDNALLLAIEGCHVVTAQKLIALKVDVEATNCFGQTALAIAVAKEAKASDPTEKRRYSELIKVLDKTLFKCQTLDVIAHKLQIHCTEKFKVDLAEHMHALQPRQDVEGNFVFETKGFGSCIPSTDIKQVTFTYDSLCSAMRDGSQKKEPLNFVAMRQLIWNASREKYELDEPKRKTDRQKLEEMRMHVELHNLCTTLPVHIVHLQQSETEFKKNLDANRDFAADIQLEWKPQALEISTSITNLRDRWEKLAAKQHAQDKDVQQLVAELKQLNIDIDVASNTLFTAQQELRKDIRDAAKRANEIKNQQKINEIKAALAIKQAAQTAPSSDAAPAKLATKTTTSTVARPPQKTYAFPPTNTLCNKLFQTIPRSDTQTEKVDLKLADIQECYAYLKKMLPPNLPETFSKNDEIKLFNDLSVRYCTADIITQYRALLEVLTHLMESLKTREPPDPVFSHAVATRMRDNMRHPGRLPLGTFPMSNHALDHMIFNIEVIKMANAICRYLAHHYIDHEKKSGCKNEDAKSISNNLDVESQLCKVFKQATPLEPEYHENSGLYLQQFFSGLGHLLCCRYSNPAVVDSVMVALATRNICSVQMGIYGKRLSASRSNAQRIKQIIAGHPYETEIIEFMSTDRSAAIRHGDVPLSACSAPAVNFWSPEQARANTTVGVVIQEILRSAPF